MKFTVAIPIYHGGKWVDRISENILKIPSEATILLSSQTPEDGVLHQLRQRHRGDKRLCFLEPVETRGWREHVNVLIRYCRNQAFAILAQDDSIEVDMYSRMVQILSEDPECSVAFPQVVAVDFQGNSEPVAFISPPRSEEPETLYAEALRLSKNWNLGIPYRGLVRAKYLCPIQPTPGDAFADLFWVFSLACRGRLREVPGAVYIKQYHDQSVHAAWKEFHKEFSKHDRYSLFKREIVRVYRFRWRSRREALSLLKQQLSSNEV